MDRKQEQLNKAIEEACEETYLKHNAAKTLSERIIGLNLKYPLASLTIKKLSVAYKERAIRKKLIAIKEKCVTKSY